MPTYGICTGPDQSHAMREAGFDYVEGNSQAYFRGKMDDAAFAEDGGLVSYAGGAGLPMPVTNLLVPGDVPVVGERADANVAKKYIERLLRRAGEAKVDTVVFGSGAARGVPEGFDRERAKGQILDFLRYAGPLAERAGVTIATEPLNRGECNILNGVAEAMEYVRAVKSPGVGCLVDSYHSWREDEPLADIVAAGRIAHVHVADRDGRLAPGGGGATPEMYRAFFGALKQLGYDGRISIEGKVDFEVEALRRTLGFLKEQWSAA